MRRAEFDRQKFRELLVYIAERVGADERFGDVKFNKVLWLADFTAYNRLGHAITGAPYQKLPLGPAARAFKPVRRELEQEGAVKVTSRQAGPYEQTATVALRKADTSLFDADELGIVDDVIADLAPRSANQVSEMSHDMSAGWQMVEMQETIPYDTALIETRPPSDHVIARGRDVAARLGW